MLAYEILGDDAPAFRVEGFLESGSDGLLGRFESGYLTVAFNSAQSGSFSAQLRITTDQNAVFGSPGDVFLYDLTAVAVPEPGTALLGGAGILSGLCFVRLRRTRPRSGGSVRAGGRRTALEQQGADGANLSE